MSMEQRYACFLLRESANAANETKAEVLRQASRMLLIGEQENRALRAEVQALQKALNFWLPCVPGVHSERDERIASDAVLLAGFDGDIEETAEAKGWIALTANATNSPAAKQSGGMKG